ncbi:MAG TPA: PAS domain-containing protein, partial [Thermoanaerobaculia bacterium]|nr:PAS domain-containing protein [Thermoanaerobaculia bacterium]
MRETPDPDPRHREALSALKTAEARSRLFFETSLAGIYTCTLDCTFLECNESFARMLGYPACADLLAVNGR